jgi:hypothetical protein
VAYNTATEKDHAKDFCACVLEDEDKWLIGLGGITNVTPSDHA